VNGIRPISAYALVTNVFDYAKGMARLLYVYGLLLTAC
jgi:hypothetical protein